MMERRRSRLAIKVCSHASDCLGAENSSHSLFVDSMRTCYGILITKSGRWACGGLDVLDLAAVRYFVLTVHLAFLPPSLT